MIELLRERFVALLQEEADVSNQLTRIENELENSRQLSQKQADQLQKLKEQLATAKEKASQQEAELETAKEQVRKLLADYQVCAKEQEEQKTSYQAQQSQLFDRLDNLKTSRLEPKVWKIFLEITVTFMQVLRVFSKKKPALVELLVQSVST